MDRIVSEWLGWQDSNLRMLESKSSALPLGDIPISWHAGDRDCNEQKNGVDEGIRTLGLQSHNLAR